jgi:hypothetical protein
MVNNMVMGGDYMLKNVLAINSSRRKMNTYGILEELKNILEQKQINVDIINLFDFNIKECVGCELCLMGKTYITCRNDSGFWLKRNLETSRKNLNSMGGFPLREYRKKCQYSTQFNTAEGV